jgi:NAD-dependent dihydropyrimidine dehydrogenase PreA subunit
MIMKKKTADVVAGDKAFFPVVFDEKKCNGCNRCVEVCPVDVFAPNPKRGKPPLILFPQECWQEGSCVEACPRKGAIRWQRLAVTRVRCKRKETGKDFFV